MRTRFLRVALGLSALVCGACTHSARQISLGSEGDPFARPVSRAAASGVPIWLAPCVDGRPEGSPQGSIGGRPLLIEDAMPTVDRWSGGKLAAQYTVAANATEAAVVLRPELRRLYVDTMSDSKNAVVVLRVTYARNQLPDVIKTYRGQSSSINWLGSDAEFRASLRQAFDRCWEDVEKDLASMIAGL